MSKVILIGANHAGIAFANTVLGNSKDTEVVIFERNPRVSYLGCGTALWVGRQIENEHGLFYTSLEELERKGAKGYVETEVKGVDFAAKVVKAVTADGKEVQESYDKLVLARYQLKDGGHKLLRRCRGALRNCKHRAVRTRSWRHSACARRLFSSCKGRRAR